MREGDGRARRTGRWAAIAVAVVSIVVLAAAGLFRLARSRSFQLFGPLVAHVNTPERAVALTLDDGPSAARLDTVLGILASRGVHATFFVTGAGMAKAPDAARRLVAAGHELGNHTYTHQSLVLRAPSTIRREVERTDSLIRAAGERGEIYFRPPYAHKLVLLPYYLWRTHRTTIMWDIEPDTRRDIAVTPRSIVRDVLDEVRPGSIILLHVWYPSRASSLAALPVVIDSLHARGYRVTTIGDLLGTASAPPWCARS